MANTYELISAVTVGAAKAAYIEFTSIPSTYTDLKLVCSLRDDRTDTSATDTTITYNGAASGGNYDVTILIYQDNIVNSYAGTNSNYISGIYENSGLATSNIFSSFEHYIPNYAGSANKCSSTDGVAANNSNSIYFGLNGGLRRSTAAITSVRVTPYYGVLNYVQYSTAYLYGIKNS
jgi:hypothetical protein